MNELSSLNNALYSFNPLEHRFLDSNLHITNVEGVEPDKLAEKIDNEAHKILQKLEGTGKQTTQEREKLVRKLYGLMRTLPKVEYRLDKWSKELGQSEETLKETHIHIQHIQADVNATIQKLAPTAPCLELGLCFDPVNNDGISGPSSNTVKDMILQGIPVIATPRLFQLALKDPAVREKLLNPDMCIVHEHQEGGYIRCVPNTAESRNLILEPTEELEEQGVLKQLTPEELKNLPARLINTAGTRSYDTKYVLDLIGQKQDRSIVSHLSGHGIYSGKVTGEGDRPPLLCNLEIDQFQQLIKGLDDRGASFVSMDSCYAGGANAVDYWMEQDAVFDGLSQPLDLRCNVIAYALGERTTTGHLNPGEEDYKELFSYYRTLGDSPEKIRTEDIDILNLSSRQQTQMDVRPAIRWSHGTQFKTASLKGLSEVEQALHISATDSKKHSLEETPFTAKDIKFMVLESLVVDQPIYVATKAPGGRPESWPEEVKWSPMKGEFFPGYMSPMKSNSAHYLSEVHAEGTNWFNLKLGIFKNQSQATKAIFVGKLHLANDGTFSRICKKEGTNLALDRVMLYKTVHGDQSEWIGTLRIKNDETGQWEYHKVSDRRFKKSEKIDKYSAMYHHYHGYIRSMPTEEGLKSVGGLESATDVLDALKEKMWTAPEEQLVLDLFDSITKGKIGDVQSNLDKLGAHFQEEGKVPPEITSAALRVSVQSGNTDVTKTLLNKGELEPDLLGLAISANQPMQVDLLLKSGADSSTTNAQGETPLMQAARKGNIDVLGVLIQGGAKVNETHKKNGRTALHYAAHYGHKDAVKKLVSIGGDLTIKDKQGLTPLHTSVKKKRFETFKTLVNLGADVNTQANDGTTPLHFAAHWGRINMLEILLWNEAEVDVVDSNGKTPLSLATEYLVMEAVGLLLKQGADINAGSVTPLIASVKLGEGDLARCFIEMGADPSAKDASGNSLIHYCTNLTSLKALQSLDVKIDYNAQNKNGETLLTQAVKNGDLDLVRELLENKADAGVVDTNGNSLFHLLFPGVRWQYNTNKEKFNELITMLKEAGADLTRKNSEGKTAAQLAQENQVKELVVILGG